MGKVKGHRPADLWAWPVAFILAKALAPETGLGEREDGGRPGCKRVQRECGGEEGSRRSVIREGREQRRKNRKGSGQGGYHYTHACKAAVIETTCSRLVSGVSIT